MKPRPPQFTTREFAEPATEGRRTWRWVLVAVVVALVAVIAGVLIVRAASGPDTAADTTGPLVDAGEDGQHEVSFGNLRWEAVGRTEMPFSDTAGPRTLDGVAAAGFAHTEAGAILAAWQIPMRLAVLAGTDSIYRKQVLGTPGDISKLRQSVAELQASLDPEQTVPRVIAWRAHQPYSEQVASYDFALPGETSTAVSLLRFSVVWMRGDWRYQPGLFGNATTRPVDATSVHPDNGWHRFPQGVS
ncbi:hypothetical protein [Gordonia sp. 'Campus']|uniref:hypothetical protein n=1 Tax=Gordonia sp. 'Campus' TaxID=2915824 RepID=UPI001EE49198|nr:hypothetical protein [Gordonia sp. 'Campus']